MEALPDNWADIQPDTVYLSISGLLVSFASSQLQTQEQIRETQQEIRETNANVQELTSDVNRVLARSAVLDDRQS